MHVGGRQTVAEELGWLVALEKETLHALGPNGGLQGIRLGTRARYEKGEFRVPAQEPRGPDERVKLMSTAEIARIPHHKSSSQTKPLARGTRASIQRNHAGCVGPVGYDPYPRGTDARVQQSATHPFA